MVGKKTIAKLRLYTAIGIYERVKKCKVGSNIAKHAWDNDHAIDFANCKVIDRANFRHRGTLESWHTAMTINADNNAKHLPEQYRFLLQ